MVGAAQGGDLVTKVVCGGDDLKSCATFKCGCVVASKILGL